MKVYRSIHKSTSEDHGVFNDAIGTVHVSIVVAYGKVDLNGSMSEHPCRPTTYFRVVSLPNPQSQGKIGKALPPL